MDELELLRQKRLRELQDMASQQQSEQKQIDHEIGQLEALVKKRLTGDAITRYGTIKLANPEKAMHLLGLLAQLIERKPERIITDEELKKLLILLNQKKG
jgi:DNA-binding TFAR19-related protein (PDSD5 family)